MNENGKVMKVNNELQKMKDWIFLFIYFFWF